VAKSLGFNPNSVRGRIGELAREDKIERVSPGFYTIVPTHGVGKLPRIQNFTAVVHPEPPLLRSEQWEYSFQGPPGGKEGLVRIRLLFGIKRNKVTWTIKAPLGLDYYGLMLAYGLVRNVISSKGLRFSEDLGADIEKSRCFVVKNVELLDDKIGLGIEGIKCITFGDLKGNLEKIYEKPYGIRREIRHTEPRPISELLALYQGGLPNFMIAQSSYDLARAVEKNTEILKYIYRNQAEITLKTNEVLKALFRIVDKFNSKEV
jgi:hypothetical protein